MSGKRQQEAHRWLHQGLYDLKAAEWNLEGGFFDTTCFLAQQSSEKVLKSLLYYLGARRKALFTHSLVELIGEAGRKVDGMADLIDDARMLDIHYIPSRYPNGLPSGYPHRFYSKKIAGEAVMAGRRIVGAVREYYVAQAATGVLEE
jgi:HEPN domain-containing protein